MNHSGLTIISSRFSSRTGVQRTNLVEPEIAG